MDCQSTANEAGESHKNSLRGNQVDFIFSLHRYSVPVIFRRLNYPQIPSPWNPNYDFADNGNQF